MAPRQSPLSWARKIIFLFVVLAIGFLLADFVGSLVVNSLGLKPPIAGMVDELTENGPIMVFDPISGYRLGKGPSRWAVLDANGKVESLGKRQGNNLGFPDDNDFFPNRGKAEEKRISVLGDSMTAGQFLPRSWPTFSEEILKKEKRPARILNFAVDGGGLANWYGIVVDLLARENYEIDGLVFAVCCDDLYRSFFVMHDDYSEGKHRLTLARFPGMDPDTFPKTLEDCRPHAVTVARMKAMATPEFDALLEGNATLPSSGQLMYATKLLYTFYQLRNFFPQATFDPPNQFDPVTEKLIARLADAIKRKGWPTLVVTTPILLGDQSPPIMMGVPPDAEAFAKKLGARVLNGSQAFAGMSDDEIRGCYFKHDGHWNVKGSDRFARFMARELEKWP